MDRNLRTLASKPSGQGLSIVALMSHGQNGRLKA
jgi:hypothetical protein